MVRFALCLPEAEACSVISTNNAIPGDPCSMLKRRLAGSSYKAEHDCVLCDITGHSQGVKDCKHEHLIPEGLEKLILDSNDGAHEMLFVGFPYRVSPRLDPDVQVTAT